MTRLIVNCDDYGMNEATTWAIIDTFKNKLCSNTTLMVNMPFADESIQLAHEHNIFHYIGLHINLTEGMPLTTEIRKIKHYCNEDGSFRRYNKNETINYIKKTSASERAHIKEALSIEVEAQILKYKSYGLDEMHADSHHHFHMGHPLHCSVIGTLLRKHGFKTVRHFRNVFNPHQNRLLNTLRVIRNNHGFHKYYYGLRSTDIFYGDTKIFADNLNLLSKNNTLEIMIHPRYNQFPDKAMTDLDDDARQAYAPLEKFAGTFISYYDL